MNHLPIVTTANLPPTLTSVSSKETDEGLGSNLCRVELAHQHEHFLTPPDKAPSSSDKTSDSKTAAVKKLIPDYENAMYDDLRQAVTSIITVSSKFELKSSRTKGVVLVCGEASASAEATGFGVNILPLMVRGAGPRVFYEANILILVLGKYASAKDHSRCPITDEKLPELILGLCCNNWGMFHGRNALIEALLEILGPERQSNLTIHSAIYALEFNTAALRQIIAPSEQEAVTVDKEHVTRTLHANAFAASAKHYGLAFDNLEDRQIDGVSKEAFVEELSQAAISAVERTLSSTTTGRCAIDLVLEILKLRRLIQDNLTNKRFRRARSQNGIEDASCKLCKLFEAYFQSPKLETAEQLQGWDAYTTAQGGAASTVLGLVCHSIDVLAGCVARSAAKITPDLAERLVLTVLTKENRLMEYTFNQVYELMPSQQDQEHQFSSSLYIYRRPGDLLLFSNMPCGVVEMGGKY